MATQTCGHRGALQAQRTLPAGPQVARIGRVGDLPHRTHLFPRGSAARHDRAANLRGMGQARAAGIPFPRAAPYVGGMPAPVIIVAHGQPSDPAPAEADLARLGAPVAARLPGRTVLTATLAAPGALEAALGAAPGAGGSPEAAGPAVAVYPFFMADGWFTRTALPRRIAAALAATPGTEAAPPRPAPRILAAFGMRAPTAGLAATVLQDAMARAETKARDTTVILAAHGSAIGSAPADAARAMADSLAAALGPADLRLGFIEEAPRLADVLSAVPRGSHAILLPLFVQRWGHVTGDIPEAVAESGFTGRVLDPLGLDRRVPGLIAAAIAAET
jgi:sirohydrochlorin ferrochelatase